MFATAMNLLNVHPIFRFMNLQPPAFIRRLVFTSSKSQSLFGPLLLGFMTVFIPCGVTQAMEVNAINSGSPIYGALIMTAFVLGTIPLFATVGVAAAKLSDGLREAFMKIAAVMLILMALYGVHGVLVVLNSPFTLQAMENRIDLLAQSMSGNNSADNSAPVNDGVQRLKIDVLNQGYFPKQFTVKAGIPVELELNTDGVYSCATSFVMRDFDIFTQLEPTDSKMVSFTPEKKGIFTFTCSMGMYSGVMRVI
jgi:uncharacterized protein